MTCLSPKRLRLGRAVMLVTSRSAALFLVERRLECHYAGMSATSNGIESATTAAHVRAARGLLGWTRDQLVTASSVPKRTLVRFEDEQAEPRRATVAAIRAALEAAGVEFTNGDAPGVRLRSKLASTPKRPAALQPAAN